MSTALAHHESWPFRHGKQLPLTVAHAFFFCLERVRSSPSWPVLGGAKKIITRKWSFKGVLEMKISKDEQILCALVSNTTIKAAAKECKVAESTIYARLKDPEFKKQYDAMRFDLLERNTAQIQMQLGSAIQTMADVMNDGENSPQVRLNAADALIRNNLKLTEQTDILRRLEALERMQQ